MALAPPCQRARASRICREAEWVRAKVLRLIESFMAFLPIYVQQIPNVISVYQYVLDIP